MDSIDHNIEDQILKLFLELLEETNKLIPIRSDGYFSCNYSQSYWDKKIELMCTISSKYGISYDIETVKALNIP